MYIVIIYDNSIDFGDGRKILAKRKGVRLSVVTAAYDHLYGKHKLLDPPLVNSPNQ